MPKIETTSRVTEAFQQDKPRKANFRLWTQPISSATALIGPSRARDKDYDKNRPILVAGGGRNARPN